MQIRHGEAVGVIGPSGTGKSTILKIMAGLLAPDKVCNCCMSCSIFFSLSGRSQPSDYGLSLMLGMQGEVYIRGKKRAGLISDEEISGLRIGLVSAVLRYNSLESCIFGLDLFIMAFSIL